MAFVMLLVVGVYIVAGNIMGGVGGGTKALAKGAVPAAYSAIVQRWGNLCPAINPALLAAQLYQESGFNPNARSAAAAEGIAQFIPGTWATHGVDGNGDGKRDVWNPEDAIPSAASYDCQLASYVKDVPGNLTENMLASYNAGSYAVIKYGGVPPYTETRNYVKTITTLEESFAAPVTRVDPSKQAAGAIYYAQKKLGTPYLWGGDGTSADNGRFDCSGLTKAAYESVGITLPRVANDQYNAGAAPEAGGAPARRPRVLLEGPDQLPGHSPRGHLRGWRIHDRRPEDGCRDPVRPDRRRGLLRCHEGHRRWRESAPHDGVNRA